MISYIKGEIAAFERAMKLPVVTAKCPADGFTKREYAKQHIKSLEQENPCCKEKIFAAICKAKLEGWPEAIKRQR